MNYRATKNKGGVKRLQIDETRAKGCLEDNSRSGCQDGRSESRQRLGRPRAEQRQHGTGKKRLENILSVQFQIQLDFELEVCRLGGRALSSDASCGVRRHRIKGDAMLYKRMAEDILSKVLV